MKQKPIVTTLAALTPLLFLAACSDGSSAPTLLVNDDGTVIPGQAGSAETVAVTPLNPPLTETPIGGAGGPDSDGDGVRNQIDLDDDNDGILDVDEGGLDANGDGFQDPGARDSDGDGTPDAIDLDSDNDGITDLREAMTNPAAAAQLDQIANGAIDLSFPVGSNGVADIIETAPDSGSLSFSLADTDGDGERDVLDLDSDNDTIPDLVEAGGVDADGDGRVDNFVDADGKGIADSLLISGLEVFDTDGDGAADFRDVDSDGDGISDFNEAGSNPSSPLDTDGDGAPDFRETDSNGDGIPDGGSAPLTESPIGGAGGPDSDGDGIRNQIDLDDDNDGILDVDEGGLDANGDGFQDPGARDSDGDGTPDALDLDSDNDGITDLREAQTDQGLIDQLDVIENGAIDLSFPVGSNGVANIIETAPDSGSLIFSLADTDGDGERDVLDLDSDNDSIPDIIEAGGVDSDGDGRVDNFIDADGKGIGDSLGVTGLELFDTDGDGAPDFRDTDSDGDGLSDLTEAGGSGTNPADTDGDGAPDFRETDSNGDGIPDGAGGSLGESPIGGAGGPDSDGDGIRNQIDLDDDNDGILDVDEGGLDENGDGFQDPNARDSDGDGTPDALDLDSDNDGITDLREVQNDQGLIDQLDVIANGAIDLSFDVGANGVANIIETSPDSGSLIFGIVDTDGDGERDVLDLDSDNDSIPDLVEAGGVDSDGDGRVDNFSDADGKGIADSLLVSGLDLFDTDGDGIADFRDIDSDNDGLSDRSEAGPNGSSPTDTDGDGAADFRETDSDGDGIPDGVPLTESPIGGAGGPDSDGDGIRNQIDLDDDNDGILDVDEGGLDANGDGFQDPGARDSDGDGTPDALDLDSDNDGIPDLREVQTNMGLIDQLDVIENGAIDLRFPVGANGVADIIETAPDSGSLIFSIADTDGDGERDVLDLDSDNDSIPDLVEAGGVDADGDGRVDNFSDADGKGIADSLGATGLSLFDTDGDGVKDFRDTDSDGDGRGDRDEAGPNGSSPRDTDGDGAPDFRETDSNGDGIPD